MRGRPTNSPEWAFENAVALVAVLCLIPGYRVALRGESWLIPVFILVLTVGLAGMVAHAARWRAPELFGLVVWAVFLCMLFERSSLRWGILPTQSTLAGLRSDLARAGRIMAAEQTPVAAATGITLILAGFLGLVLVAIDALLHRWRSIGAIGIVLAVVFVVPTAVAETDPNQLGFIPAAACWLFLLRRDSKHASAHAASHNVSQNVSQNAFQRASRGQGTTPVLPQLPAALIALAAVAIAISVPRTLPSITSVVHDWGTGTAGPYSDGIDPNVELGQNLRRNTERTVLTFTTTLSDAPYLKVATLQDFTGQTWRPDGKGNSRPSTADENLSDLAPGSHSTDIEIENLRSDRVPVPYPASEVSGLDGDWEWQRAGLTMRSSHTTTSGQSYTVVSPDKQPTEKELRAADDEHDWRLRPETRLPHDTPRRLGSTARKVTEGKKTDFDKAEALQDWLRSSGDFSYSTVAPVEDGYDGTGLDVVSEFLTERRGYCIHFASTMAVLARELDIPARLAVGFAPGSATGTDRNGKDVYEVTTDDAHAWPELFFEGVGWVRFDPTPGVGSPLRFTPAIDMEDVDIGDEPAQEQSQGPRNDNPDGPDTAGDTPDTEGGSRPSWWWLLSLPALMVLASPGIARWVRRRARIRSGDPERLWRELVDSAGDIGRPMAPAATPRQFAACVADASQAEYETLMSLVDAVESRRYGPDDRRISVDPSACMQLFQAMSESADRKTRWRNRVMPPSVFRSG